MPIEQKSVEKFALVGPASVGKTTMTGLLRNRFAGDPRVQLVDEAAKIFFESQPGIPGKSLPVQERLQDFVWTREKTAANQPGAKVVIADRSVIDPVVYTRMYDTREHADRLLERVAEWLPTYTSFVLLNPAGVPDDPRPARLETADERFALYDRFGEFCVEQSLPYVEVSGTLPERSDTIQRVIFENVCDKTIFGNIDNNPGSV